MNPQPKLRPTSISSKHFSVNVDEKMIRASAELIVRSLGHDIFVNVEEAERGFSMYSDLLQADLTWIYVSRVTNGPHIKEWIYRPSDSALKISPRLADWRLIIRND